MDMIDVLKILLRLFEQGFSKEVIFSTVLKENTRQLSPSSSPHFPDNIMNAYQIIELLFIN